MMGFFESHQPSVWSTTHKDASITVSGLIVSGGGGGGGFVSGTCVQRLAPNQKLYWEVTINATADQAGLGVQNINAPLTAYTGSDTNGISLYFGGVYSYGGSQFGVGPAPVSGNIISVAIDGINQKMWTRANGGNWNGAVIASQNPATNIGGASAPAAFGLPIYIAYTSNASTGEQQTLNAGSTAFTYTPPVGFRAPNSCSTS